MQNQRKILGDYGENLAREYLEKKGYEFLGRNIRLFCGEIDLLFGDGKNLVIVEVKTKTDESYGRAAEMITPQKRRKLLQLGKALWQKYPERTVRIDVVAIDEFQNTIEHIINAVEE